MTEQQSQQVAPKNNKVYPFLMGVGAVIGLWFIYSMLTSSLSYRQSAGINTGYSGMPSTISDYSMADSKSLSLARPVANMTQSRKVTTNHLSVHVKEVGVFHADMVAFVESVAGKTMNEYITVSSDDQSESGTLTVLVPNSNAQAFFDLVGTKAIKVVDRQISSYEISQEYTDISRQLAQYEVTYAKVLKFYDKANTVAELIDVQSQLTMVQQNIDSLKGRKMALDELSSNTQYTIYSSTNEFNLPYVPQGTFEFAKTFKLAVRSLIGATDTIVSLVIYLVVFSPLLALAGLLVWAYRKYVLKK